MDAEHIRAARALLKWSQADLSAKSGVSVPTIKRIEATDGELTGHATTINALEAALIDAGITLIPENGGGAGARFSAPRKDRS